MGNWLFDFCEAVACVSGNRQCAKCGLAFCFSFLRVDKKTKSFFFHCHFFFHSQTIISVIFGVAVFFFALLVTAKIYLVQTCDPKLQRLLILHTCIEYIFMCVPCIACPEIGKLQRTLVVRSGKRLKIQIYFSEALQQV